MLRTRERLEKRHQYVLYGVTLETCLALNCSEPCDRLSNIKISIRLDPNLCLRSGLDGFATHRLNGWEYCFLPHGAIYLRWPELADFTVSSDGCEIVCRVAEGASGESWQTYLLGPVFSFALLKNGIEALHATAIEVNGGAVGFLGGSGQGKSTLAAALLQRGHRLLTDDLLVLGEREGAFWAHPGPARIKLFPNQAHDLARDCGAGTSMNALTSKLVLALRAKHFQKTAVPLRALYVLHSPEKKWRSAIRISTFRPRNAFLELLKRSFNRVFVTPDRIRRQFELVTALATKVPIRRVSYPRDLANLPRLCDAVLADLRRHGS